MSIDVELALVLGLFMIGAVVLAVDNLVYALSKRLSRWMRNRKSVSHTPPGIHFDTKEEILMELAKPAAALRTDEEPRPTLHHPDWRTDDFFTPY